MIRLHNVSKLYPARATKATERATKRSEDAVIRALDHVSLAVERGEWVPLMGPSGSGKSTLVNLVGCLDRPSSVEIWLDGTNVAEFSPAYLNRVRAEKI